LTDLPAACWGTIDPAGDTDRFEFEARAGQTLVFDLAARSLGSKANATLTLMDPEGRVLESNAGFDGGLDPFLAHTFAQPGRYSIRVNSTMLDGSPDHFYRLSMGAFPFVTGHFPLSLPVGKESPVQLVGYNLSAGRTIPVKPDHAGEIDLPLNPEQYRSRRSFKVLVTGERELIETEPNDSPAEATPIEVPCVVGGRIFHPADPASREASGDSDTDLFRFEVHAGQTWILETEAARRGSPLDTKIEVLQEDGTPVERLWLQAVRDSAINFRPIDANGAGARLDNWREMELTQYLYLNGEVVRLFRMPQGPDSDMQFFTSGGKRRAYFDTTAVAHALDEPCYIVQPHPPGAKLVSNGLPVFPLFYANDDDGERRLGADSKVHFTAPKDGAYLIRVSDTRRFSGERLAYRLLVREARPDFRITLQGANPAVSPGSGRAFAVNAERLDGFDGEITVEITGVPPGFTVSNPLVIQAGHEEAKGVIYADIDAPPLPANSAETIKVTAWGMVNGQKVTRSVNSLGKITLAAAPKLYVTMEPSFDASATNAARPALAKEPATSPMASSSITSD
jgi:hypothetical protein